MQIIQRYSQNLRKSILKNKNIRYSMGLDINVLRAEKGGNPDLVKESQRRRNPANPDEAVARVDKVIELDEAWRKSEFSLTLSRCRPALASLRSADSTGSSKLLYFFAE